MFNRRTFVKTVATGLLLWPVLCPAQTAENRPNILLLFADQHRADAMGCAGNSVVLTPVLDRLAAQGTRFARAYSQDAICVPSRTSMMCGLYPRTTGVLDNPDGKFLNGDEKMVPLQRLLRRNGYYTGCLGKRHLPASVAGDWDFSATTISPKQDLSDENYYDWIKDRGQWEEHQLDWEKGPGSANSADLMCQISKVRAENSEPAYVADRTIAFLKKAKKSGKPFFCWSSFLAPHQPYVPSKEWAAMYPVEQMTLPASWNEPASELPPGLQNWRQNERPPWDCGKAAKNPVIYKRYVAYYYALVSEVDHYLGAILQELEDLGLADNTIVIYSSDHGDFVAAHGMVEKCARFHNAYEDTLHVPLIISWPSHLKQGQVCNGLAELVDLYPTVLELTGIPGPEDSLPLAGKSLVPTLTTGAPIQREYAVSENWSQICIIGDRYKFAQWIDPTEKESGYDFRGKSPDMLFDRETDPIEVKNRIGKDPEVEQNLRAALATWESQTSDSGKQTVLGNWLKQDGKTKKSKPNVSRDE